MRSSGPILEGALYLLALVCFLLGQEASDDVKLDVLAARSEGTLRVISWNVGGAGGEDGHPLADASIPAVAETLTELGPDLVLLQEMASASQVYALVDALGDGWTFVVGREGGRRLAALSFGGELEPFWSEDRCLGVVLRVGGFGPVSAVGVHADAWSSAERNLTIGSAVDRLMRRDEEGGRVLAGDLNLDVDVDKRSDLFSDDSDRDVWTYNYVATRLEDAARGLGSTAEPDRRLDYLFVDERLAVITAGPWKGRRVNDMDHDPVVADVAPSNTGGTGR